MRYRERKKRRRLLFLIGGIVGGALLIGLLIWWIVAQNNEEEVAEFHSLDHIEQTGKLVVAVEKNPTDFYLYEGRTMGFQYDMLVLYAEHLGVELQLRVVQNPAEALNLLEAEEVDFIAVDISPTQELSEDFDFTNPHSYSRQVLVQRNPTKNNPLQDPKHRGSSLRVHVPAGSSLGFRKSLPKICRETLLFQYDDCSQQVLNELVRDSADFYTLAYEKNVNADYVLRKLNTKIVLGKEEPLCYLLNKNDTRLYDDINVWLDSLKNTQTYAKLLNYYYGHKPKQNNRLKYDLLKHAKLSSWDSVVKSAAAYYELDWRLVASMIYQESRFNPAVEGRGGTFGLMQFTPRTAEKFGVSPESTPEEQIWAGVKYIKHLMSAYDSIPEEEHRIKFAIAAYNAGKGHIDDARRLAEKYDKDPDQWTNNVQECLLWKSQKKYYSDAVVRCGRFKGNITSKYVESVYGRYAHYKQLLEE